jgi:transposase
LKLGKAANMENKASRPPYPSDVSDEEWAFVEPFLTLIRPDAEQREYELREIYNGVRYIMRAGCAWRYLPHDLPPWWAVYQQYRRWLDAGCFEDLLQAVRKLDRKQAGRPEQPTAAIYDSRTLRSTPESGARAGYDGHKRTEGSKIHLSTDTRGNPLAVEVSPADEQDRTQVGELSEKTQIATANSIKKAFSDQAYTGKEAAQAAERHGIELVVIKLEGVKGGFVLLPRRWVVEHTFAWAARFRRLARDYERLTGVLAGAHIVAFGMLLLHRLLPLLPGSS